MRPSSGKYEWIDRTEAVLLLQRVWRAYAASTLAALTLHESQQRRLGGVRSVLLETALLLMEQAHARAHHGARTPSPQVRSVLHETALLPTEQRLSWLGVISAAELEQQRRQLTTTLRELIQARASSASLDCPCMQALTTSSCRTPSRAPSRVPSRAELL